MVSSSPVVRPSHLKWIHTPWPLNRISSTSWISFIIVCTDDKEHLHFNSRPWNMIGHACRSREGLTASQLATNSEASAVQENTWRWYTLVMNCQQDACQFLADNWSNFMHPTFPSDASASCASSLLFKNIISLFLSAIVKSADFACASRDAMRSAIESRWLHTTGTRIAKTCCYIPAYCCYLPTADISCCTIKIPYSGVIYQIFVNI